MDGNKIIRELAEMRIGGAETKEIARFFHRTVIEILSRASKLAREKTGIETIGLTGGCFMNRFLHEGMKSKLHEAGFRVLTHRIMPTNDGCISLGQAVYGGYRVINRV
jgi:hydrogenase maturation protein HypF